MTIYNFSAGPACLPDPVLNAAGEAAKEYKSSGISILEMSHRSGPIVSLFEEASQNIRALLSIPYLSLRGFGRNRGNLECLNNG